MNSKKTLKIGLWDNIKKNCKTELIILMAGILWTVFCNKFPNVRYFWDNYFSENRCAAIASFMGVEVGIYVAIWSILTTSTSRLNSEILKEKIESQLLFVIIVGIVEAFISIFFCVFIPTPFNAYSSLLLLTTLLALVTFVKFLINVLLITKLNIQHIVKEIDEQNSRQTEFSVKLDEVYRRLIKQDH